MTANLSARQEKKSVKKIYLTVFQNLQTYLCKERKMDYDKDRFEALAEIVKASAHPAKLFLLEVLLEKSYCVRDLTAMMNIDISTVSKHLTQMKANGLLTDERVGNCVYYHIRCDCVRRFYDAAVSIMRSNIDRANKIST